MFNVFINDIFYFIQDSTLYNYADDNTLSYTHSDCTVLKSVLERDSEKLIEWFSFNNMKANPDKFQAICLGKKANDSILPVLILIVKTMSRYLGSISIIY